MIIENGTIEFKDKPRGEIDPETGHPVRKDVHEWGEPIPCQFTPNSRSLLAKSQGEPVTTASYTVLVEEQPLPDKEQVRLKDLSGRVLGEFSMLAPPELLEAVAEIKILI